MCVKNFTPLLEIENKIIKRVVYSFIDIENY
jgi:hypothetical protein